MVSFLLDRCICINQQDKSELAGQISIMRDIYSCAEQVLIWLWAASPCKNADAVFTACTSFADRVRSYMSILALPSMRMGSAQEINWSQIYDRAIDLSVASPRPFTDSEMEDLPRDSMHPYRARLCGYSKRCARQRWREYMWARTTCLGQISGSSIRRWSVACRGC